VSATKQANVLVSSSIQFFMPSFPVISLRGRPIADGKLPLICTPLVGRTTAQLHAELDVILPKQPDVLEWRIDFFDAIADTAAVLAALAQIRQRAPAIPLLFTRRSTVEGGEKIPLSEAQVLALYETVCASGQMDLIDYELANNATHVAQVRAFSKACDVALVLSFHNFTDTPDHDHLVKKFLQAQQAGADVAKVAVMPHDMNDVLTLLQATQTASTQASIPLISMAMGPLGALTRVAGWMFGSSLSFAVGAARSAPGQIPVEELRTALHILQRAITTR